MSSASPEASAADQTPAAAEAPGEVPAVVSDAAAPAPVSLSAAKMDGTLIEADLSDLKSVAEVRSRIANALGKKNGKWVKLLVDGRTILDENELSDLGFNCTVVVTDPYMLDGKAVKMIAGSAVYGFRSVVYFEDGSTKFSNSYETFFPLIEECGFKLYKSFDDDRYYRGEQFEAIRPEDDDPSEWVENVKSNTVNLATVGSFTGWQRKNSIRGAGGFLGSNTREGNIPPCPS